MIQHRVPLIIGLGIFLAFQVIAADPVVVDGKRVTVTTARYRAIFDGLTLAGFENRLTGETYAVPAGAATESAAMQALAARSGIAVESLRPAIPVMYYTLCDRTKVSSEKTANGIRVTYEGLAVKGVAVPVVEKGDASEGPRPVVEDGAKVGDAGGGAMEAREAGAGETDAAAATNTAQDVTVYGISNPPDFEPAMKLAVTFAVDAETGDLVVTPEAYGHIEKVADVRDRGVLRAAIQVRNLAGNLRLILPSDHGVAYTAETVPPSWSDKPAVFRWPYRWEAALFIAEGTRGCLGIWADEPKLRYGRILSVCRSGTDWGATIEFENTDMNYRCDALTNAAWRLNAFSGNWTKAAGRYRDQMRKQWLDLEPLAQRKPAWADSVRLVVEPDLPDEKMAATLTAFPRDRVAVFCREGWSLPWEAFRKRPPTRVDTCWPSARPWGFAMPTNLPERVVALEARGIHVFPYANQSLIQGSWIMQPHAYEPPFREDGGYLYTWRPWARFFPEACREYIAKTGASGLCEGFSWVMRRHLGGEPPGENWFTGSLGMRTYLRELLPDTALMGDQVNEVTCRGQHLSRAVTADFKHAHPVSSFLFGSFTRQWSASAMPEVNAADDIHGFLPGWPSTWAPPTPAHPLSGPSKEPQWQEGRNALPPAAQTLLRTRGELFVNERLESVWPESWDARVLHYYRGKDGTEYRLLADQGTRLIKVAGGKEETLYWRVGGVSDAALKGYAIPQWVGYDGDRAIGLNPDAVYLTDIGGIRPPVVISSLPKDAVIARTVHGAGYWMADLRSAPSTITLRVKSADRPVSFSGVDAVKELAAGDYEVAMKLPGSLLAYWEKPESRMALLANGAYRLTMLRPPAGLESSRAAMFPTKDVLAPPVGSAEDGEESVVAWLIRMPLEQPWLVFKFGGGTKVLTQGVRYRVRVNGRTVWERLRVEAELKWSGNKMALTEKPVRYGAVNLKEYEDKTVLVELVAAAQDTGAGNGVKWENPRLMGQPPTWDAEMDKTMESPKLDEMPTLEL